MNIARVAPRSQSRKAPVALSLLGVQARWRWARIRRGMGENRTTRPWKSPFLATVPTWVYIERPRRLSLQGTVCKTRFPSHAAMIESNLCTGSDR